MKDVFELEATARLFSTRINSIPASKTSIERLQMVADDTDIQYILAFGGGYELTLTCITVGEISHSLTINLLAPGDPVQIRSTAELLCDDQTDTAKLDVHKVRTINQVYRFLEAYVSSETSFTATIAKPVIGLVASDTV